MSEKMKIFVTLYLLEGSEWISVNNLYGSY